MKLQEFTTSEAGTGTIYFVAILAASAGLGVAVMTMITPDQQSVTDDISAELNGDIIQTSFFTLSDTSDFESGTNMVATGYGFLVSDPYLNGWKSDTGADFALVSNASGITPSTGSYMLDMEGAGGFASISRSYPGINAGQTYDLSFDGADLEGDNGLHVYFAGTFLGDVTPADLNGTMQSFSFTFEGGTGNGSNVLQFVGTDTDGASDGVGMKLDNISVQ